MTDAEKSSGWQVDPVEISKKLPSVDQHQIYIRSYRVYLLLLRPISSWWLLVSIRPTDNMLSSCTCSCCTNQQFSLSLSLPHAVDYKWLHPTIESNHYHSQHPFIEMIPAFRSISIHFASWWGQVNSLCWFPWGSPSHHPFKDCPWKKPSSWASPSHRCLADKTGSTNVGFASELPCIFQGSKPSPCHQVVKDDESWNPRKNCSPTISQPSNHHWNILKLLVKQPRVLGTCLGERGLSSKKIRMPHFCKGL